MLEVAEIIRLHGAAYLARFADRILPSHRRALRDLDACRTPTLGGHVHRCDRCGREVYAYHSCRNRHCPKCHRDQTERWLTAQRARLLPCAYYLLTFTLPDALRPLARSHQTTVYGLLMKSAAAALLTLARDPRYVGGRLGCLAVLHTWTRALLYHPHVHLLVTAGGLSSDGTAWVAPKYGSYLVPVQALSRIFRAKICAALKHAGLLDQMPRDIWTKPWVVHCQHAGRGQQVLDSIWAATSSVSPSPTAVSNGSRTGRSPSAIGTIAPNSCAGSRSLASSFSSASSSMSCRAGVRRCATTGSGVRPAVVTLSRPVRS